MTISKNKEKFITSLRLKKFRQKYNNFIVEGDKMVRELLVQSPEKVVALYALESWLAGTEDARRVSSDKCFSVSPAGLKRVSNLNTPNQVLAVAEIPEVEVDPQQVKHTLSLFLDGIQDPGNLGTILRIADWFGIHYVFLSPDCVDPYNPKVVQASMGALLRVHCVEASIGTLCEQHPGLPVYGAVMEGENVFTAELKGASGMIVIGSEGKGISPEAERYLSHRIAIPPAAHSRADSLNAAIATGILCAVFLARVR
ncbi:MAG: RNA methyltransferase [Phaeodactylibacter sp.]|nr:RNA methyltransferase [Phaeodactylibacter sp.]MCB9050381.1 RNA methyltransferase [Lewinellaceae bacterium]